jgi:enamine deaminase RidA (YjgF/YER057c/UK114 family)
MTRQVDTIMEISQASMGRAGGRLEDVVRCRIYVTDIGLADEAGRAMGKYFRDIRPASTLVEISGLARPTQLVEIELDAIDGAAERAQKFSSGRPTEETYGYSRAVRVDDRIYVAGTTALDDQGAVAHPGDMQGQTKVVMETIASAVEAAGGSLADIVYSKTFITEMDQAQAARRGRLEVLGEIRPTSTLLGIPALLTPEMLVEIEAEAIVGAAATRQEFYSAGEAEKARGYARAVAVGDVVHVSGCTSMGDDGTVGAPGDWAGQFDLCHEAIQAALADAGTSMDDVVTRRIFTVDGAKMNRPYGEGPPWFANSRPVALGCDIAALADPSMMVEIDALAIKGAHADIEWLGPED